MRAIRKMSALALVFAVACSGGAPDATGGNDTASGSFDETDVLQSDGPIRGVALTEHVDRSAPAIRPTLTFTSKDTEATAVIGLGDVPEGSTLSVTWYRLTGIDERDLLFSHEIAVGPGGQAFSQAIAAGGLAPGTYDTVATMDDHLVHTPWVVQEAKAASPDGGPTGLSSQAASGDEPWDVPESGDSGWYEPDTPPASPPPPGPCEVTAIHPGFDPLTDVMASVFWIGQCSHMALAATISGAPQEVASTEVTEESLSFLPGRADLCDLPGRSDLPGTVVKWAATGSEGATGSATFTVPDFGETLEAFVQAATDTPSRVDPGYKIELRGMAVVMPPALGIKELSLFAGDQLIQTVGNASGTDAPQPCDFGRYAAVNRSHYTVPSDPPPVIEICAEALGFDGTESRNCVDFYTGEVWEGTAKVTSTAVYPDAGSSTCRDGWDLEFTFVKSPEGTIAGQGTAKLTSAPTCPFPISNSSWKHVEFQVLGEEEGGGFALRFAGVSFEPADGATLAGFVSVFGEGMMLPSGGQPVSIAVSGTSGTGQGKWQFRSGNPPATYSANGTVTLECVTCEKAVG